MGYLIFLGLCGGCITIGALAGLWYFSTGHETHSRNDAVMMVSICAAFVLLGAYNLALIFRYKVILGPDAITTQGALRSRTLTRADIAGYRILPTQYVKTLVVLPRSADQKKLKIALLLKEDLAFHGWFESLPDLDAREIAESREKLVVDPDLGFSSEDRLAQIKRASVVAKTLSGISAVAGLWGYFVPRPYIPLISVLAALPLIALILLLRTRNLYQVEGRKTDARPSLAIPLIAPSLVLALRALLDFNLLEWKPIATVTILVAVLLTFAIAASDSSLRKRPAMVILFSLFTVAYGYGIAVQADVLPDRNSPQLFHGTVTDKHESTGKTTTYHLELSPWGPQSGPNEVTVQYDLYRNVAAGESVCLWVYPGMLHAQWYQVTTCLR